MKKLICLILALLLLTGCASSKEPTPTEQTQAATAPTVTGSEPTVTIPTDPIPTDPIPTDPVPTDPIPTDPVPTDPIPTDPTPTDPEEQPPEEQPPEEELFQAHEKFDATVCASVVGTWSTTITLSGALQNLEMFTERTSFRLHYTFDENGYFRVWADQTEFDNAIDEFEAMVIDHMMELSFDTFKGPLVYQGVPEDQILERWMNGAELEARVEVEESVAALNLYHRFKRLLREGQYHISGGKLYTQFSEDSFEANGYIVTSTSLTLRNTNNMSVYRDICINFPWLLEKSEQNDTAEA